VCLTESVVKQCTEVVLEDVKSKI
jgi:hypothetical protein